MLETIVSSMTAGGVSGYYFQARGASPVVVLSPEHAAEVAADGFRSRMDVREFLFQHARIPLGVLRGRGHWGARSWPDQYEGQDDEFLVPLVTTPGNLLVMVAGGDGRHSSWMPA